MQLCKLSRAKQQSLGGDTLTIKGVIDRILEIVCKQQQ
jgi:hypothetical protein